MICVIANGLQRDCQDDFEYFFFTVSSRDELLEILRGRTPACGHQSGGKGIQGLQFRI